MAGENFIKTMQEIARGANPDTSKSDIVRGKVTSISPIEIKVESGMELTKEYLFLSPFCLEKIVYKKDITENPHIHATPDGATSGEKSDIVEIKIWRGLKVGDDVLLLRYSNGNQYYVLQREGKLEWE